jgi:hypothetical protein
MELVSSLCWNADVNYPNTHDITYLYSGGSLSTTYNNTWLEFLACWETTLADSDRTFGLGYYKFTGKVNGVTKDYAYIDYRTSDLPENFNSGGSGDLNITFNISDGNFYYYNTQYLFPASTSIWDEKNWIYNYKEELEPLEPENLSYTPYQDHPKLQWNHSSNPGDYLTHYEIHRAYSGQGWIKIATQSSSSLTYTDNQVYISQLYDGVSYKIRSKNGSRVSDNYSNTIVVGSPPDFRNDKYGHNEVKDPVHDYILTQNFPNPFNPSTTIKFSLKEYSLVTLKIFDILGSEVTVLINEFLSSGDHQAQFDGSSFVSGVYFYEIRAGNFRDVKKLILTK